MKITFPNKAPMLSHERPIFGVLNYCTDLNTLTRCKSQIMDILIYLSRLLSILRGPGKTQDPSSPLSFPPSSHAGPVKLISTPFARREGRSEGHSSLLPSLLSALYMRSLLRYNENVILLP